MRKEGKISIKNHIRYIRHFSARLPHPDEIDYLWITHLHADHVGLKAMLKPGLHGYDVCGVMRAGDFFKFSNIVVRVYPGGNSYQVFVLDNKSLDYHVIYKTDVIKL